MPPLESVANTLAQRLVSIVSPGQGLQLVSVEDPHSAAVLSVISTPDGPRAVAMWARSVFVSSGERLKVWDVSDPRGPSRVTSRDFGRRRG